MEDQLIIEKFFERSEDAISQIGSKYGRLCMSMAKNILNNNEDAEECVNDAYLGIWNSIPPERPSSLAAYLLKIVRNLSLKKYRYNTAAKRNSHMDVALEELEGCLADTKDVEQQVIENELSGQINVFLEGLKEQDRVIFMQRYFFAAPYEEIAAKTGISSKNVSVRLVRIRSSLREYLRSSGYME